MKEKLIELLNAMIGENKDKNITTEVMADYLIQNGVVVLPCKVWDKAYLIKDNIIEPCTVEGIHYTARKNYVRLKPYFQPYIGNQSVYHKPSISSFGKIVFLSCEEAEKALKE